MALPKVIQEVQEEKINKKWRPSWVVREKNAGLFVIVLRIDKSVLR